MSKIIRHDINEEWAHAGLVEAGLLFQWDAVAYREKDIA